MIRFAENLNKMITAGLGGAVEAPSTEVALGHRVCYIDASGPVATFETNIAAPIRSLRVDMQPIQAGSGDPSPDNIRPITGRDSVTVERTGKNLLPLPSTDNGWENGFLTNNGDIQSPSNANKEMTSGFIPIPEGTRAVTISYTLTDTPENYNWKGFGFFSSADVSGFLSRNAVGGGDDRSVTHTATVPANAKYMRCTLRTFGMVDKFQVEIGSTPSAYAPYDGASVTIRLGQTVYGGTVDVTGGKVRVTDAIFTLDGSENDWYLQTAKDTGTIYRTYALKTKGIAEFSKANYCTAYTAAIVNMPVNTVKFLSSTEGAYVCLAQSTLADFKAFLSANPLQIDCKLAEPFDIDITPASLSTLKGDNNVWSDAGDVTLEYPYYEETEGY